jgi:hypothetical protein
VRKHDPGAIRFGHVRDGRARKFEGPDLARARDLDCAFEERTRLGGKLLPGHGNGPAAHEDGTRRRAPRKRAPGLHDVFEQEKTDGHAPLPVKSAGAQSRL